MRRRKRRERDKESENMSVGSQCSPPGPSADPLPLNLRPSLRGVLMSSQHGPLIFLLRRKCSRLVVLIPNTWENVAPFRSTGSVGYSACGIK